MKYKLKKLFSFINYRFLILMMILSGIFGSNNALAIQTRTGTVAYWRFEAGPAGSDIIHIGDNGVYYSDVTDVSGNENHLSVWTTGGQFGYRSDVAFSEVPRTDQANTLSVKNVGGNPAMWCATSAMQTMTPAAFSIEATFKVENDGYRTIIGRDSYGTNTEGDGSNLSNAALYLQTMPFNRLAIKFCDVSGYWHEAATEDNAVVGYNWGDDPDGANAPWYSVAAVSDGSSLSLYLLNHDNPKDGYRLVAQIDMTLSGSPDTALTVGAGDGGDWDAGDWTVGRGLWDGGHGDRWYGYIDEVRISNAALIPSDFLASDYYADTVAYWRFEEGPVDSQVAHGGLAEGDFYPGVIDITGKGNNLSVSADFPGGHIYRDEVASSSVAMTNADNNYSVQNSDMYPGLFTSSADVDLLIMDIETWTPVAFTVEASFKPESSGYQTIVGRDADNVVTDNGSLSALYFQTLPDNSVAIKFADISGYWHEAISEPGLIQYDGFSGWYHMAAICDGTMLRLYLNNTKTSLGYQLVAQTDMTVSSSPDTRLIADSSVGSNWHGGGWTVGRGLFNGEHTDGFFGLIDEVRISSAALDPNELLFYEIQYAGIEVTPDDLVVYEEGATTGELLFKLDNPPVGDVVLTIQEQYARGQVTLDQSVLTFTTSDWNIPQPVRVTAVDDLDLENAMHRVLFSVMVSSVQDSDYEGLDVEPPIVKVADNECGAWGYAAGDFNLDCVINLDDMVRFAGDWLACSDPDQANCSNYKK